MSNLFLQGVRPLLTDSVVKHRIERRIDSRPSTLLGLGPMSKNCVDAAIEVANECDVPIMLVASRRQIECEALGGGYVEGWTTESFAKYVHQHDLRGNIIMCRDHGGPWQGTGEAENKLSFSDAMERAKISYAADITSGLSVIHIDPSIDPFVEKPPVNVVVDRLYELYHYCWQLAMELGRDIVFEVGTEEQSNTSGGLIESEEVLKEVARFCQSSGLPMPIFSVLQIGTKVIETYNTGSFADPFRVQNELPPELHVPQGVRMLRKHGVHMKVHNSDYLDDESLSWMPRLGIAAANIAPEFGVLETRTWFELMEQYGASDLAQQFTKLSLNSEKWRKWMAEGTTATDRDRAEIAGHYVFGTPEFRGIAAEAEQRLAKHGVSPQNVIRARLKKSIRRYIVLFRQVRQGGYE